MQDMKKSVLGQQFLLSQLKGMIIFDRRELRPLGLVEGVIFRREDLRLAFFQCLVAGDVNYIRADQTAVVKNLITTQGPECFGEKDDFVREKTTFAENCRILGYKVRDTSGIRLGHIEDCSVKLPLMYVDRLYVRRPLLKSFQQGLLVIQTSAITDIQPENKLIVVHAAMKQLKKTIINPAAA